MKKALIVVDIQNDFMPGGALPASLGYEVIPIANAVQKYFELIVATQDWHPANHGSFASQHHGHKIGDVIDLAGIQQVLWPDHCVEYTEGADFVNGLNTERFAQIFHKGIDQDIDSYSAFFDNGHRRKTGLEDFLKHQGVTDIYLIGMVTDYCIKYSATDAYNLGFKTFVIEDGCRAINLQPNDAANALAELKKMGVKIIRSTDLEN